MFIFSLQLQSGKIPQDRIEEMGKNGRVILSVDASKPLKNTPPLYIVRDVLTSTTIASEFIIPTTKDNIKEMLFSLKERLGQLKFPIKGIISDKEPAKVQAIEETLSGAPHQLCHTHFLDNATKPAVKADIHVATQIRKEFGHNSYIKEVKKKSLIFK
ncbi:MAG: hypothetical protein ACTSRG_17575 [Candidatus Helarchaeota archaeon]